MRGNSCDSCSCISGSTFESCFYSGRIDTGAADEMKQMQQDVSRHRYKHKPPGTPEGFWDMGFPGDSQDCRT